MSPRSTSLETALSPMDTPEGQDGLREHCNFYPRRYHVRAVLWRGAQPAIHHASLEADLSVPMAVCWKSDNGYVLSFIAHVRNCMPLVVTDLFRVFCFGAGRSNVCDLPQVWHLNCRRLALNGHVGKHVFESILYSSVSRGATSS